MEAIQRMSFGKIAANIPKVLIKKNRKNWEATLRFQIAAIGAAIFATVVAPAITPALAQTPVVTDEMMVQAFLDEAKRS
jgi:hypothetical protein